MTRLWRLHRVVPPETTPIGDLNDEREVLLEAKTAVARRAGSTVYHGDGVRQTLVVTLSGEQWPNMSPSEGFLHVLEVKYGSMVTTGPRIAAGQLFPVRLRNTQSAPRFRAHAHRPATERH